MSGRCTVPSRTATAMPPMTSKAQAAISPKTGEVDRVGSSATFTMATTLRPRAVAVVVSPGCCEASVAYPATDRSERKVPPSRLPLTPG